MADVLNRVLNGHVNLEDLLIWLKSDISVSDELTLAKKLEFVPFFLKYVRENNSWVLNNNISSSTKTVSKQNLNSSKNKTFSLGYQEKLSHNGKKYIPKFLEKPPDKSSAILSKTTPSEISPPDINSLESFPPIEGKVQGNKTKRRIAPTPVPVANKGSLKFGNSGFATLSTNFVNDAFRKTPYVENSELNLHQEREMLKLTKNRIFHQSSSKSKPSNVLLAQEPKNMNAYQNNIQFLVPNPEFISNRNNVLVVAEIYNLLLCLQFVPNVTAELFFMFKLLTARITSQDEPSENDVFCSIHNCVYFAVSVLNKQLDLLKILDNTTLATLSEIPFLSKFSPELISFLKDCSSVTSENTPNLPASHCVPFLLENDSKGNFPDEKSFFNFKKQRDLFFELLKEWQQQSLSYANSKFHDRFLTKAKLLISLNSSSSNMYHLAVLFQSQLISSCLCFELNETCDTFLNETQKNFPGRLEKLHERFIMPFRLGTLNPSPKFYGVQHFFCELIQAASSSTFNQHLLDVFIAKIVEMNDTDIFSDELSSTDTVKQKYIFLLHSIRLLGKFLGYIVFLPYKDEKTCDNLVKHAGHRKYVSFPLNIPNFLETSIRQQKLILTVPWVVEYLSMIAPGSTDHEEIQKAVKILVVVYKSESLVSQPYNVLFLRLLIGWLFDILQCEEAYRNELFILPKASEELLVDSANSEDVRMDSLQLIDKQIIHSCCPYLVEFRVLICSFLDSVKHKHRPAKKITPVSSAKLSASSFNAKQKVQKQLEETFLFFNPSLKETVEFVSESITLKFVQKIKSEVKNLKLECVKNIINDEKYFNSDAKLIIDELVELHFSRLFGKLNLYELIAKKCEADINEIIPILLSDDIKPQVLEMCSKLSFRRTMNILKEWWDAKLKFHAIKCDIRSKVRDHTEKVENVVT